MMFEYKNNSLSLVLWSGLFIFFLMPHAVDIFVRSEGYSISTYNKASLFAILFNLIYLATRIILKKSIPIIGTDFIDSGILKYDSEAHATDLFLKFLFCSLIISLCLLLYFIKGTFGSFLVFTWIDMFERRGGIAYIIYSYLFTMCIPFCFLAYKYKRYYMFATAVVIVVALLLIFRVRSFIISITVPFLLAYIYNNKLKINFSRIVLVLSSVIFIIWLILGVHVLRIYGTIENIISESSFSEFNDYSYGLLFSKYGEFGLRNAFYFFIDNDNNFSNFGIGRGYIRLLMLPIPSFILPGIKPNDFAMDMAFAYDPIASAAGINSMHPTLYGDCYANLGWIGIFLGAFWALITLFFDRLTRKINIQIIGISIYVAIVYAFVLIARGAIYNGIFIVFFTIITHLFLWFLCKKLLVR